MGYLSLFCIGDSDTTWRHLKKLAETIAKMIAADKTTGNGDICDGGAGL